MDGDPSLGKCLGILRLLVDSMQGNEIDLPPIFQEKSNEVVKALAPGISVGLRQRIRDD
jgi:hypothetical protein